MLVGDVAVQGDDVVGPIEVGQGRVVNGRNHGRGSFVVVQRSLVHVDDGQPSARHEVQLGVGVGGLAIANSREVTQVLVYKWSLNFNLYDKQ